MERHGGTAALDRSIRWRGMAAGVGIRQGASRVLDQLLRWQELASQRRQLRQLDDRMLRDLGLSRADVEHEGRRPFWDVGSNP